ncbi:MAG: hypothetical protein U9Q62_03925 [Campylobacterota bacterium]|nr:hypothetical protein [Campylobacterota bacterium]
MFKPMSQLLHDATSEEIISAITLALENSDESPFWVQKTVPFLEALLSVLEPLKEQQLLFTPEGKPVETLTPELLLGWCDLLSLKTLAFTLQKSNASGRLERTDYAAEKSAEYKHIDLEPLGSYLSSYTVDLENESLDFPIANYNLHIGMTDAIKKMF